MPGVTTKQYTIAVVGATGVVGGTMIRILRERDFPVGELRLLASARSAGRTVTVDGVEHEVREATPEAFGRAIRFATDPDAVLVETRDGSWRGWASSTRESLAPRTVASKLGRWALVPEARYAETLLVDRHAGAVRAAYPDALEPICPAPDGVTFATWSGGELELLRVAERK